MKTIYDIMLDQYRVGKVLKIEQGDFLIINFNNLQTTESSLNKLYSCLAEVRDSRIRLDNIYTINGCRLYRAVHLFSLFTIKLDITYQRDLVNDLLVPITNNFNNVFPREYKNNHVIVLNDSFAIHGTKKTFCYYRVPTVSTIMKPFKEEVLKKYVEGINRQRRLAGLLPWSYKETVKQLNILKYSKLE